MSTVACTFCRRDAVYLVRIRRSTGDYIDLPFCSDKCEKEYISLLYDAFRIEYEENVRELLHRTRRPVDSGDSGNADPGTNSHSGPE
jgi:hypothetical protein